MPAARTINILSIVLLCSGLGLAQGPGHPSHGATGSRLIAWSELQKPKPVPQSAPQIEPLTDAYSGIVSNGRGAYTLEMTDSSAYVLDDHEKVKPYLGAHVQITGSLDAVTGVLHVIRVDAFR